MIFLNEIDYMKLYKKPFHLPIDEKDKKKGSSIFLLTPNIESSVNILNNPLLINKKYFESYFIEKDITYYINQEGYIANNNGLESIKESNQEPDAELALHLTTQELMYNDKGENIYTGQITESYQLDDTHLRSHSKDGDIIILFNENLDEEILNENKNHNSVLNKLLYHERLKTNKDVFEVYDIIKEKVPYILKTYLDYPKYKKNNIFVDLFYYNQTFFKNNIYRLDRGIELYFDFINRFINDKRLDKEGYEKKTVILPIHGWEDGETNIYDYKENINPISMILRLLHDQYANRLLIWENIDFIILSKNSYIKLDLSKLERKDMIKLSTLLEKLYKSEKIEDDGKESTKSIVANIVDKLEDSQKIKINNLTGDGGEITKDELVKKIEKAATSSNSTEDAIDQLEDDNFIKNIIDQLASEENNKVDINNARLSRMNKLNDEFHKKQIHGKSVKDLLDNSDKHKELPVTKLDLDTVNDEWSNLQYVNFENAYDIDEDIVAIINSLSKLSVPMSIRDIRVEDTSTSEDLKETYIVQLEDVNGDRFTIKFDVPKFKDDKFMMLRGNDKTINGQLVLLPISKTDEETVQIVSNYKKIFIRRYGSSVGKSFVITDRLIKALGKYDGIKTTIGNNVKICSKYELPIDYIDLSSIYSVIENKEFKIYFNQDEIREKYKIDLTKGIPFAIKKSDNSIVYYNGQGIFSVQLLEMISSDSKFVDTYNTTSVASKYMYSQASILSRKLPLILIMAYNEGLVKTMKKGNIKYEFIEKRPKYDKNSQDMIKFKDGYILYELDYNSSLLMNGLKECNTEDFPIGSVNDKSMYLEFLEQFGGRILADGLDNFYDLMIDPITEEVLEYYKLPTDYIELLAYANLLLSDNKYVKHTDMRSNRYRSNEIIAGYVYQSIAEAYEDYKLQLKRRKKGSMSMKQTTVLDKVLLDPTCSDMSTLNPLLDIEAINSVSFKGLAGMNTDRSYSLDKRTFDDSMLNVLGLSTGFAGNVGITRQATMDMNIEGKRGYIKITKDTDDLNITKTFTATEALTPFGATRDDPFRSAMTFIQTSKHGMRIKKGDPLLISNGADQALPYMTSNTFAYNAKEDGKVIEKTDDYIIVEYKDGRNDYVDLRDNVKKNSNGGFFVSIKLDSDLKVGSKFKKNDILAYDKLCYSDKVGHTDNLSYNLGTLTKIAILNTDEGFEDSAIISDWLSDAMASDVVIKKEVTLPKNTNIYNMVKKGQDIQEGDPLLVFQNAFDDEDVNILLKNLVDDEDMISDLGRIPVKSKVTGQVQDIKIYRTVEKEDLSDSIKKKVNEIEKPISDLKKVMKKYDIDSANRLEADYKLEATGKLKNVEDSVMIEFFLKYEDKMSVGDKLIYYSALKGVIKDIFPKGKEPYTNFRPEEKIHSLLSQGSVVGRMVGSVILNLSINKVLIELDRKVKDIAGIPWKNLDEE